MSIYTDRLLMWWDRSYFGWTHGVYTHRARVTSPVCGDEVEFGLIVQDGRLVAVDCEAHGCCVCECCTAMLAELARNKPVEWLTDYSEAKWVSFVDVPDLSPARQTSCVALPLRCLKSALQTPETDGST